MATYSIVSQAAPYTTILVEFGGQAFQQTVLLSKAADLQAYADAYETDFAALVPEDEQ